jgi:hypothetical protein
MTDTLDYADPTTVRSDAKLPRFAVASLLWPVLVVTLLYGEWLLATWSLGHVPRPSIDDPMDIAGSRWMHIVTTLAVLGAVPAAFAALVLNTIAMELHRPTALRGILRLAAVMTSWAVLVAVVYWDPGKILFWWLD